jgi:hypothetical protein
MNANNLELIRMLSFVIGFPCAILGGCFWISTHEQLKLIKKLGNRYYDNIYCEDKDKLRLLNLRALSRMRKFFKAMCFIGLFIFMFGWVFLTYLRAHFYI